MASARDLRILSLQALYALDMADGRDPDAIRAAIESGNTLDAADDTPRPAAPAGKAAAPAAPTPQPPEFTPAERRRAFATASAAWEARDQADEFFLTLAPTWPASRQPVIDRSILRLAWHEMHAGKTAPRIVVDEAIDIARAFSTEKSPAFINALLDKALKRFEDSGAALDTDDPEFDADDEDAPGNAGGPPPGVPRAV